MKRIILLSILSFAIVGVYAQRGYNLISPGVELGIPVGDLGRSTLPAPGASIKLLYGLGIQGQAGVTAGFLHFAARNNMAIKSSSSEIPLLATYRQHLDAVYLEPQIGASIIRSEISGAEIGTHTDRYTAFAWAVGGGYLLGAWDFSIRFQSSARGGGGRGFVGIRAGYNFRL